MKIVVAAKPVADLDDDFEMQPDGRDVDPDYIEWDLNEWDSFALEEASQLGERAGGAEVVAVSVGDSSALEVLRVCLARGADRAVRIWDDALPELDALATAKALAALIAREEPDLVLFGVQSSDGATGATGAATAALLRLPRVAVVRGVDYDPAQSAVTVVRELEGGAVELLRVSCPVLLTIQTGINEPRYATLRAIKQAEQEPIEEVSPGALGLDIDALDAARGAEVMRMEAPQTVETAQMIEGDAAAIASEVAGIVRERLDS